MGNIFKKTVEDRITSGLSFSYENSRGRNVYLYNQLKGRIGKISLESMKEIYRQSGAFPTGSWKAIKANYQKTGKTGGNIPLARRQTPA